MRWFKWRGKTDRGKKGYKNMTRGLLSSQKTILSHLIPYRNQSNLFFFYHGIFLPLYQTINSPFDDNICMIWYDKIWFYYFFFITRVEYECGKSRKCWLVVFSPFPTIFLKVRLYRAVKILLPAFCPFPTMVTNLLSLESLNFGIVCWSFHKKVLLVFLLVWKPHFGLKTLW